MSDKKQWPIEQAKVIGASILASLHGCIERGEIVGSVRRGKPLCSDVEVLYISKSAMRKVDMFNEDLTDLAEVQIGRLLDDGTLAKRPNVNGSFTYGPKNKLLIHVASGIPVDLFSTTAANWAVSLVIRTGSKETNLRLTTGAQRLGGSLMAYGCGVKWENGNVSPAGSEQNVFDLCGVPYLEPEQR